MFFSVLFVVVGNYNVPHWYVKMSDNKWTNKKGLNATKLVKPK